MEVLAKMKILKEKYPKGSFKGQISDGRYIDGYLFSNLQLLAKKVQDDMTFLGIIFSSTLEVGTGKSVLATQIGEAWSYIMKTEYNIDVPFIVDNIVWNPEDLIKRSFKLPRYSCILLDEWETTSYWSKLSLMLRHYFQKCRQLNQFVLIIIPNFFRLPIDYAVSRSVFAIDVRFGEGFRRGDFAFYDFDAKKWLYIKGKKTQNYKAAHPVFTGHFTDGYGVDEIEYRRRKFLDMMKFEKEGKSFDPLIDLKVKLFQKLSSELEKSTKEWAEILDVSQRTIQRWKKREFKGTTDDIYSEILKNITSSKREVVVDEKELEKKETERGDLPIINIGLEKSEEVDDEPTE